MNTTSASLLHQLRHATAAESWARFVKLYTPLLFFWASRLGLDHADAADLVQEVFATLVQKLPYFNYQRDRGFRNWLRTVLVNKWRDHCRRRLPVTGDRADAALAELAVPDDADAFGEAEYRRHLVQRALELMQAEFPAKMWKACWEHIVHERPAAEVAAELGIAVGTVYVAESRVLRRLREELEGLLD